MKRLCLLAYLCSAVIMTACGANVENQEIEEDQAIMEIEEISDEEGLMDKEDIVQMGHYTLEECKNPGIYVLMEDGSFEKYQGGNVLTWNAYASASHGTDYTFEDLIMDEAAYNKNLNVYSQGQLVLFCDKEDAWYVLNPVEEIGRTMTRYNEETGKKEALFFQSHSQNEFDSWINGDTLRSSAVDVRTINGISCEEYDKGNYEETRRYLDLPENEKYKIGIADGTALLEREYVVDSIYFLQSKDVCTWKLEPTTEGYATLNFSEVPAGDYIFSVSWWNDEARSRTVISTYIKIG